jgi:hypothetical protein
MEPDHLLRIDRDYPRCWTDDGVRAKAAATLADATISPFVRVDTFTGTWLPRRSSSSLQGLEQAN